MDAVKGTVAVPATMVQYTYTLNNPLKYIDSTGMWSINSIVEFGDGTKGKQGKVVADNGDDNVRVLQLALKYLGYNTFVDGGCGDNTRKSVLSYINSTQGYSRLSDQSDGRIAAEAGGELNYQLACKCVANIIQNRWFNRREAHMKRAPTKIIIILVFHMLALTTACNVDKSNMYLVSPDFELEEHANSCIIEDKNDKLELFHVSKPHPRHALTLGHQCFNLI